MRRLADVDDEMLQFNRDLRALMAEMAEETLEQNLARYEPYMRWNGNTPLAPAANRQWSLLTCAEKALQQSKDEQGRTARRRTPRRAAREGPPLRESGL